jgi:glycosyltransferase 2 family protein
MPCGRGRSRPSETRALHYGAWFNMAYLAVGLAICGYVLASANLGQVGVLMGRAAWVGLLSVFLVSFLGFAAETWSWMVALPALPSDLRHFMALLKIRIAGEALSDLTVSGVGGEPIKLLLVKWTFGIDGRAVVASLIIASTTLLLSFIVFAAVGLALLAHENRLPGGYLTGFAIGLAGFSVTIGLFYLVQRYRLASFTGSWFATRIWHRLARLLHHVREVDDRLHAFYTGRPARVWIAMALAFAGWVLGALELYVTTLTLGVTLSASQAWSIEAVTQLARQATFFIPLRLGVQEASLLLVYGTLTGDPSLGLAVALVRRAREAAWVGGGLLLGWYLMRQKRAAVADTGAGRGDYTGKPP